ncbi:UNVERIFIED_ORG: hypothetical protein L601_000800000320 [Gordonia westfalica J30]
MIGRPVDELCESELWPLKPRYVKHHLSREGGKFQGLGTRIGRRWLLSDEDVQAIKDRLHEKPRETSAPPNPSGLSPRSRFARELRDTQR